MTKDKIKPAAPKRQKRTAPKATPAPAVVTISGELPSMDEISKSLETAEEIYEPLKDAAPVPKLPAVQFNSRTRATRELDVKAFTKRLYELMSRKEMRPTDLAKALFGTRQEGKWEVAKGRDRVSYWLSGKQLPDAKHLARLAELFDVNPETLIPSTAEPAGEQDIFNLNAIPGHPGTMHLVIDMKIPASIAFKIAALLEGVK